MSSSGNDTPSVDRLRSRLKKATRRYHSVSARRNALSPYSPAEIREMRSALKRGARAFRSESPERMKALIGEYKSRIGNVEEDIEELAPEEEPDTNDVGAAPVESQVVEDKEPDDQLDRIIEDVAFKYRVVNLMQGGMSAREALEEAGVDDRTPRWARKIYQRFREEGPSGLIDGRIYNGANKSVLTPQIRKILIALLIRRPAAPPSTIWDELEDELELRRDRQDEDLPLPSVSTVKSFIRDLPPEIEALRTGGLDGWDQSLKPLLRLSYALRANERWQSDHTRLDIWVRRWVRDHWVVDQAWLSVTLDLYSRAIPGFVLRTARPTTRTLEQLLWRSVLPHEDGIETIHGIPEVIQTDQGSDFMSKAFAASLAHLKIRHDPDPPNYPERKGAVERWFETLDHSLLRSLPGHMEVVGRTEEAARNHVDRLLTDDQLRNELREWVSNRYHKRQHSSTEREPVKLWEETVALDPVEDKQQLKKMLYKSDETRVVQQQGICFRSNGEGGWYWHPALIPYTKTEVRVRYDESDLSWIIVADLGSGDEICEAERISDQKAGEYKQEVVEERRKYRSQLKERLAEYRAEAERLELQVEQQRQWAEAREQADELSAEGAPDSEPVSEGHGECSVEDLVDDLRRADREGDHNDE